VGYTTRDADSRLYAQIAARMAVEPLASWIAPVVPPGWPIGGLFREHPVGIHLLPALLARLGYPALQAAFVANALYQVLSLILLQRLASTLVNGAEARALAWIVQLLPIAFTYRIRANHEQALLLCLLLALLGIERARRRWWPWGLAVVAGLVGLLLVKGVLVVMGVGACAVWLLVRQATEPDVRAGGAWASLLVAVLAMLATAGLYEQLYRQATGEAFWTVYLGRQLGIATADQSAAGLAQKAYNLVWYLGRVLWFPFPWSLTFAAAVLSPRSRVNDGSEGGARAGVLFVLLLTSMYLGAFSLSDRRADRYIFPVYYAVAGAGAVAALRAWPRFHDFAARVDRGHAWVPAALWATMFGLHLLGGWLGLPTVKIWAPDS
jgi:4-amino-4-deoxy-L-arabinose transferase-like glycosyltransferase